jgi:hypothetical protein
MTYIEHIYLNCLNIKWRGKGEGEGEGGEGNVNIKREGRETQQQRGG